MPATRSQKAALASPLANTRKRSVSRAPSAEPPARKVSSRAPSRDLELVVTETTTTTTATTTPGGTTARFTKRKHYQGSEADVEEVEEEVEEVADERPRKKQNTLKDQLFREEVQKRLAEKKLARAQELAAKQKSSSSPAQLRKSVVLYGPGQSEQPSSHTPVAATAATPQRNVEQQPHDEQHQSLLKQHHQPQQYAQPQYPQLQPPQAQAQTPQRGFLGRLIETISPFKRRPQTPSGADTRTGLIQQQQTRIQHPLNNELSQVVEQAEHKTPRAAPHQEYEEEKTPGSKRKRTAANEITGLQPLNVISESPEIRIPERIAINMSTPSRDLASSHQGIVPKSLPRPRRSVKDARARRSMRGVNEPATPIATRTAPTTPYDKNNYERIRRAREMEQLIVQREAMEQKLAKLRAEQLAAEEAQPRKTKRVKLEHLKSIPHNLPNEPSGSFRVPEADSDDEMEVDDDASVVENVFVAADDEETTPRQTSPVKSTPNLFASAAPSVTFEMPAAKAASPVKKPASPVKRAPSPVKKAPSPVKKVVSVVEVQEDEDKMQETSPSASPEPTQVFSDESDHEFDIDDEDWPELEPRKEGEPEPPQWWKDEALAKFDKEFEHWQKTGEITV
ncbi:hypothetical protein Q7P36_002588 [Cladosporium allicinum]